MRENGLEMSKQEHQKQRTVSSFFSHSWMEAPSRSRAIRSFSASQAACSASRSSRRFLTFSISSLNSCWRAFACCFENSLGSIPCSCSFSFFLPHTNFCVRLESPNGLFSLVYPNISAACLFFFSSFLWRFSAFRAAYSSGVSSLDLND